MFIPFVKKLPAPISVPIFYAFITAAIAWRFVFGTAYGWLLVTLLGCCYIKTFTTVQPLTPSELLLWSDGLSEPYKVALISASLTVIGFVVAFHAATMDWRNQLKAQLRAQVAGDFEGFFATVTQNITSARIYARSLVNTVEQIQTGIPMNEARLLIGYLQDQSQDFMTVRATLSQATVEVHRLIGRSYNALASGVGLPGSARLAADCLSKVTEKMWIPVPIVDLQVDGFIESFVDQVDVDRWSAFANECETNYDRISGISGGVQGHLTSPIWGFSFPMYVNIVASWREFRESVKQLHDRFNA